MPQRCPRRRIFGLATICGQRSVSHCVLVSVTACAFRLSCALVADENCFINSQCAAATEINSVIAAHGPLDTVRLTKQSLTVSPKCGAAGGCLIPFFAASH